MTITRRDFLNGTALAIGASILPNWPAFSTDVPYPPALTGMRGSHRGAFETAHKLAREGETFDIASLPVTEAYDLVIVGGGIAGLSAAYFASRRQPEAKILVIDNHDDFGGHAKRNEFTIGGKWRLGYGGSESFQSPRSEWSETALGLIKELGIDLARFEDESVFHRKLYPGLGLSRAIWFNREDFGEDKLLTGDPTEGVADDIPADARNARDPADFIAEFPLSEAAKSTLLQLYAGKTNYLADIPPDEREDYLDTISYSRFLSEKAGLPPEAVKAFQKRSHDFFGAGIDTISAAAAYETGYPGFGGLGLERSERGEAELTDAYVHHFPDGNAGLARLLVKALIPDIAPGDVDMDAIVQARFDYSKLDRPGNRVRIRLSSTGVRVENRDNAVEIGVLTGGAITKVKAKHAILSCNAGIIPWICPELPMDQKTALSSNVRLPLIYANVGIRNWTSFVALKTHSITAPMGAFSLVKLDYPVSLGGYAFSRSPEQPMILHLVQVPVDPADGGNMRDQARLARNRLLEKSFEAFEAEIRDQLQRMLGPGGFDAARDIEAITINRWSHGYSSYYDPMIDGTEEEQDRRVALCRQPKGRISLGLSDTGWDAYAHIAIDEASRAVTEQFG